jgi:hypothetical protein
MTIEFSYEEYAALNQIIADLLDDAWEGTEVNKSMLLRIAVSLHNGNPASKQFIERMAKKYPKAFEGDQ